MNGMSEKEERDERNDQAYVQWTLQQARITQIRLVGRPRAIRHDLSGVVLVQTAKGHRYRLAFSGVSWHALAAMTYAPSSSKAMTAARKAVRAILQSEDGLVEITEMRAATPSRKESLATIRRMLHRDKPGHLLGMPIR